jgi:hypothetical protein
VLTEFVYRATCAEQHQVAPVQLDDGDPGVLTQGWRSRAPVVSAHPDLVTLTPKDAEVSRY